MDTLGSAGALLSLLLRYGYDARVCVPAPCEPLVRYRDSIPNAFQFLWGVTPPDTRVAVFVDCGTPYRTGGYWEAYTHAHRFIIDHHARAKSAFRGSHLYIVPSAVATALLVDRFADAMNWALTPEAAQCLLVALVAETVGMRLNVSPSVLRACSRWMQAGANWERAARAVSGGMNASVLETCMRAWLESREYRGFKIVVYPSDAGSGSGWSDATAWCALHALGYLGLDGVVVARPAPDGGWYCWVQTGSGVPYDVGRALETLGGGGHRHIGSCHARTPETVIDRILSCDGLERAPAR
jgi:nanoRNase/pAp phosphatase (c-di-AMP/oligoRNAs hydrolase)